MKEMTIFKKITVKLIKWLTKKIKFESIMISVDQGNVIIEGDMKMLPYLDVYGYTTKRTPLTRRFNDIRNIDIKDKRGKHRASSWGYDNTLTILKVDDTLEITCVPHKFEIPQTVIANVSQQEIDLILEDIKNNLNRSSVN